MSYYKAQFYFLFFSAGGGQQMGALSKRRNGKISIINFIWQKKKTALGFGRLLLLVLKKNKGS